MGFLRLVAAIFQASTTTQLQPARATHSELQHMNRLRASACEVTEATSGVTACEDAATGSEVSGKVCDVNWTADGSSATMRCAAAFESFVLGKLDGMPAKVCCAVGVIGMGDGVQATLCCAVTFGSNVGGEYS